MAEQQALWHERMEDALRAVVDALGGPKRVAVALWGESMGLEDGRRKLLHCLDPERREKLDLADVEWLGLRAREADCHVLATYLMRAWGYEDPRPLDPETEADKRRREFVAAVDQLQQLARSLGVTTTQERRIGHGGRVR